MPLLLECPSGHRLKIPSKLAGHTIVCPVCEEKLDVPPLKAPAPAPGPLLRPVEKKQVSAIVPPAPAAPPVREEKPKASATPQAKPALDNAIGNDSALQDAPAAERSETDPLETEFPKLKSPVVENSSSLSVEPEVISPTADIPTLPDLLPAHAEEEAEAEDKEEEQAEELLAATLPVDESKSETLEGSETNPQPPSALNHPVATAWEEQPWSAMQTRDVATPLEMDPMDPEAPIEDELFSEQQSYLIDQVVAEAPAGPAWVFVDEETTQTPSARTMSQPQNLSVFLLALAAVIVAMLSIVPAVMDHLAAAQEGGSPDRWTYIVLLGAVVQIAVAILVTSIPDWSTQWIGALVTTGFASLYALGLALTMFARQDHVLVRDLGLLDEAFRNQAQPWCFFVLCMTLILAFCYGRASLRWYYTEKQVAVARG